MNDENRYLPSGGMPPTTDEHKERLADAIRLAQMQIDAGISRGEYTHAQITGVTFDESDGIRIEVLAQGAYDFEKMKFDLTAVTFESTARDDA